MNSQNFTARAKANHQIEHPKLAQPLDIFVFDKIEYAAAQAAMQQLALRAKEQGSHLNQIWLLQHPSVYTQGTSCVQSTLLPSDIPVVKSDRGGQITYHGPGQLVMYPILNLKEWRIGVKALVWALEQAVITELFELGIEAERKENAPGVYVQGAKIAALGLRVKNGISYHGLSFNLDMDLAPFGNIDPCGFQGLKVVDLKHLLADLPNNPEQSIDAVGKRVAERFVNYLLA